MSRLQYKDAGVNREAAYSFVDSIAEKAKDSKRNDEVVLSEIGDFGGFFQAPKKFKDPIFCAATDGVGTKLLLAEEAGKGAHRAVGQDAVAMCVNDLIACRAEPIIFLDYVGVGRLNREVLEELLEGIVGACKESNCALIGGETAQMPGFYPNSRYDVAGFSVGALDRSQRLDPKNIRAGDIVFGMESDGFHSNGFSLVRKVMENQNWKLSDQREGLSLGEYLLKPTRLYVKAMVEIFERFQSKGAAHITGGGVMDNLPRCFDESKVKAVLQKSVYQAPPIMKAFIEAAGLSELEAYSTWNCGFGFCFVLNSENAQKLRAESSFMETLRIKELGRIEAKSQSEEASVILQ